MNPSSQAYTVAMPWYERADFYELWALSADQAEALPDYDRWHAEATRVMNQYLAEGRVIQFIRIRPAAFLEWLGGAPNNASMRRTYVEYLATGCAERTRDLVEA